MRRFLAGLFRKQKRDEGLISFSSIIENGSVEIIIDTAREIIRDLDPSGCVMAMVAYKNMKHIYFPASKQIYDHQVKQGLTEGLAPNTIESYAKFLSDSLIPNEETRWRLTWFIYGLLLMKAGDISQLDASYKEKMHSVWTHLRQYRDVIDFVLENNVIWTADEKDVGMRNMHTLHL